MSNWCSVLLGNFIKLRRTCLWIFPNERQESWCVYVTHFPPLAKGCLQGYRLTLLLWCSKGFCEFPWPSGGKVQVFALRSLLHAKAGQPSCSTVQEVSSESLMYVTLNFLVATLRSKDTCEMNLKTYFKLVYLKYYHFNIQRVYTLLMWYFFCPKSLKFGVGFTLKHIPHLSSN